MKPGPWPFLDLLDAVRTEFQFPSRLLETYRNIQVPQETIQPGPENGKCNHGKEVTHCDTCLDDYPQSLFPNWMKAQQAKSGIYDVKQLDHPCSLVLVEMSIDGRGALFSTPTAIEISKKNFGTALEQARGVVSFNIVTLDLPFFFFVDVWSCGSPPGRPKFGLSLWMVSLGLLSKCLAPCEWPSTPFWYILKPPSKLRCGTFLLVFFTRVDPIKISG